VLDQRGLLLRSSRLRGVCSMPSHDRALWALRTLEQTFNSRGAV